jgi:cytochrome c-type biogenesis protein CcmH/NrfG
MALEAGRFAPGIHLPRPNERASGSRSTITFDNNVLLDAPFAGAYPFLCFQRILMQPVSQRESPLKLLFLLLLVCSFLFSPIPARTQDSSGDTHPSRGDRAEISVTVRDNSGETISVPASVKLLREGMQIAQENTSRGRAFFILPTFGEYTVVVEAVGYKAAQKDAFVRVPIKVELDVNLLKESDSNGPVGGPGGPILAPKAKEAFEKGMQALRDDNLLEAEKYLGEAMKLAPGHPEVLYIQGVLDLKRHNWPKAQTVLEKSTQIDPNNARAFSALGMALCNQKKYSDAIAPLEKSLQLDATSGWETHWALAEAYYHQERYEDALKQSQQAQTEANGQAPQTELILAKSLTAVGRYEDAAQVLRDFLKNHPGDPEAPTARRWLEGLKSNGKIH